MYTLFSKAPSSYELLPYVAILEVHHDDDCVTSFQKRIDREYPSPIEFTDVDAIFGPENPEDEDS